MRSPRFFFFLLLSLSALSGMAFSTVKFKFDRSTVYPFTEREIIVTVPDRFSFDRPAAVYVGLDGILCNAPQVIDSLTAAGKIPPTVGIFIQPGVVRNSEGKVIRYNRSNEFDLTDGRFAEFLEKDILPAVNGMELKDGRVVRLSDNPDDRMIFGLSSGGIAAFNVAWTRPDLFRRVFSGCGTFVPMRGGNDLQAVVRKTEPKPLRIFLQDGFSDTWNPLFGSWYEANRILASALEFAGYDCGFDWAEGGHSVRRASEIFSDVMVWMWRGYPAPLSAGKTSNDLLGPLLEGDSDWIADSGISVDVTDTAVYPDSSLCAVRTENSDNLTQYLIDSAGNRYAGREFYWLHSPENRLLKLGGMAFDGNGNLWTITSSGIQICDQNGRVRGILPLPYGTDAQLCGIEVNDGEIRISGFKRKLNVKATEKGVRPDSQGQG